MNLEILLAYKDDDYSTELIYSFETEDYNITRTKTIEDTLKILEDRDFNLAIIDMNYDDGTGLDLKKQMNEIKDVPTIVVTTVSEDIQKILALEYGCDDYIVRPFNILELKARIRALIRRVGESGIATTGGDYQTIKSGDFEFNIVGRKVKLKGKEIDLTGKEFDFLYILAMNPGIIMTREELAEKVWDENYEGHLRTVDVHIRRLREKIEREREEEAYIQTKWGEGYYFGKELTDE